MLIFIRIICLPFILLFIFFTLLLAVLLTLHILLTLLALTDRQTGIRHPGRHAEIPRLLVALFESDCARSSILHLGGDLIDSEQTGRVCAISIPADLGEHRHPRFGTPCGTSAGRCDGFRPDSRTERLERIGKGLATRLERGE
jgi:hypothetical protein